MGHPDTTRPSPRIGRARTATPALAVAHRTATPRAVSSSSCQRFSARWSPPAADSQDGRCIEAAARGRLASRPLGRRRSEVRPWPR
jgi:hypothetical protein